MDNRASLDGSASRSVLLLGPGELPDATQCALQAAAARVTRLSDPSDAEIREALSEQVDSVIVFSRDDAVALRLALVVENIRPGVHLIVTVHSRIVAAQLERAVDTSASRPWPRSLLPRWPGPASTTAFFLSVRRTPEGFSAVRADDGHPRLVDIETSRSGRGQRLLANLRT